MNKALTQKELREWIDVAWSEAVKEFKYTPWFHGTEVPSRIGVYERQMHNTTFFSYWDGKQWWPGETTPASALMKYWSYREVGVPRWVSQLWYWRGLLK